MTVLRTERLTLRPASMADWPLYRDFYASDAADFVGGPTDEKTAWRLFSGQAGHWPLLGFGWFVIEDATGAAGTCGLHHPPYQADLEIGWVTFAAAQGKGYATEAARAVLTWGWTAFPDVPRIVSYIDSGNAASQAVAAKLGAAWSGDMATHDPACQVWHHRRPA
jgi:RimJ/RimL family protein N-acetyltransferase